MHMDVDQTNMGSALNCLANAFSLIATSIYIIDSFSSNP